MMKRRPALFLLALVFGFASPAPASEPVRPNVLVVVSDTLRRDHLGCYGYERDTSPNIDSFSEDATLFELAYAQSPVMREASAGVVRGDGVRAHLKRMPASATESIAELSAFA